MADLDEADRAILAFIAKLAFTQQQMVPQDLDLLRRQGFSDVQILEITTLAAFFNYPCGRCPGSRDQPAAQSLGGLSF